MKQYFVDSLEKKDRIAKVRQLAKCRSATTLEEMKEQEETIRKQVFLKRCRWTKLV
jgi:hypothetical protein